MNISSENEEYKMIIDECSKIQDEELPADFSNQLHSKLVDVVTSESKSGFAGKLPLVFRNRYIKIASSIAAVLLLAVIIRGILNINNTPPKNLATAFTLKTAEGTTNGTSQDKSVARTTSITQSASKALKDADTVATPKESSSKAKRNAATSVTGTYSADAPTTVAARNYTIADSSISLNVSNSITESENIKSIALSYGGTINSNDGVVNDSSKKSFAVSKDVKIELKIPVLKYDSFVSQLKKTYGVAILTIEETSNIGVGKNEYISVSISITPKQG